MVRLAVRSRGDRDILIRTTDLSRFVAEFAAAEHRERLSEHAAAIPRHMRIYPILVDITVEDPTPFSPAGEADPVAEAVERREVHDHHHVMALALHPAMKGQHAVAVVDVHDAEARRRRPG